MVCLRWAFVALHVCASLPFFATAHSVKTQLMTTEVMSVINVVRTKDLEHPARPLSRNSEKEERATALIQESVRKQDCSFSDARAKRHIGAFWLKTKGSGVPSKQEVAEKIDDLINWGLPLLAFIGFKSGDAVYNPNDRFLRFFNILVSEGVKDIGCATAADCEGGDSNHVVCFVGFEKGYSPRSGTLSEDYYRSLQKRRGDEFKLLEALEPERHSVRRHTE